MIPNKLPTELPGLPGGLGEHSHYLRSLLVRLWAQPEFTVGLLDEQEILAIWGMNAKQVEAVAFIKFRWGSNRAPILQLAGHLDAARSAARKTGARSWLATPVDTIDTIEAARTLASGGSILSLFCSSGNPTAAAAAFLAEFKHASSLVYDSDGYRD